MIKKSQKGFTLVELSVASIIMLITVSGAISTFVASMKATRHQMANNQVQNIIQRVINEDIRNIPFSSKTSPLQSLCGNPDTVGSIAYQLRTNIINTSSNWNINLSDTTRYGNKYSDELKKISPTSQGLIEISPIKVASNFFGPIYSTSKVNVKVTVKWKNGNTSVYNQLTQSTVVTNNGVFINDKEKI